MKVITFCELCFFLLSFLPILECSVAFRFENIPLQIQELEMLVLGIQNLTHLVDQGLWIYAKVLYYFCAEVVSPIQPISYDETYWAGLARQGFLSYNSFGTKKGKNYLNKRRKKLSSFIILIK